MFDNSRNNACLQVERTKLLKSLVSFCTIFIIVKEKLNSKITFLKKAPSIRAQRRSSKKNFCTKLLQFDNTK